MDFVVAELPKRRGRKRKIIDVHNGPVESDAKRVLQNRPLKLVGRYVIKKFRGSRMFLGKIVSYDSGLYRINYENGDCEDLDSIELKTFLIGDGDLIGIWHDKKEKLDNLLHKNHNAEVLEIVDVGKSERVDQVHASTFSDLTNGETAASEADGVLVDADSSSDSSEEEQGQHLIPDMEVPRVPLPDLPPSSGHIGVPEEYVSHLLSVYAFLRSFNVPLFLYPFGLDEFVGALNCSVANTLLDSIHVAFMHVLHRHFERLSLEGSELALKCLRCLDWSLLDAITWPVYVVTYLATMGYTNGPEWKGFYSHSLERDYYTLSAGKKLVVLQILCDDVLDSEELRAEMEVREGSEIGIDVDNTVVCASLGGPRRLHPRYSKMSACNDREGMKSISNNHEMKSSVNHSMAFQVVEPMLGSAVEDGNGDECRLCGMDGFLLCCDGCPSSYHSRCLGLNKMYMPEGSWYCPECKINATEPKILQGTELRAGDICGVDPYEQVFIATCDHLVVLKASTNSGNCLRYYNRHDIPRVLHALCSKSEHAIMYSEICQRIVQYWQLQGIILPQNEIHEISFQLSDKPATHMTEIDYARSCVTGASGVEMISSHRLDGVQEPEFSCNIIHTMTEYDQHKMRESVLPTDLIIHASYPSDLSQKCNSNVTEAVEHASGNDHWFVGGHPPMEKVSVPFLGHINTNYEKAHGRPNCGCLYIGSSFKTSDYINYYLNGDFAAAAASHLAILSSEENQVSELRTSYNRKKGLTDSVSLQLKAFSMVAMRFFWPNTEKKLVEVPRERCSWCFSCKASVSSRKGCLLNAAASNTTKGAIKALAGVRPLKNGDGRLPGISAYIMFIEENLRGLVVGPFLNDNFRRRWRKQVEQASTCKSMKILLLELEENIRSIALSEDWKKLVDCVSSQHSSQGATSAAGSTQKRKPGRRGRKPSTVIEIVDDTQDESTDFTWWRGGSLSKFLLRRGILPCSMIRKAARQGGSKKIPRIHYLEGQEIPKRTRQLVWRAAAEMSRSIAQLAHQVRCLDFHVRWGDLVRPEQITYEGKGPETEASAFRNAFVCDKKIVANEIRYCVAFGKQKHLPSRVMKNITEVEQILDDGKERYWFQETRIPLYLIKEYEEKFERNKHVDILSKLQKRRLKALHKNIFSYLSLKRDNMERDYCCSCHQDLLYRNAVQCAACQGFCHEHCASSLTVHVKEEVEFLITCKQCCDARRGTHIESINASPTSPLLLQGQDFSNAAVTNKTGKFLGYIGSSGTVKLLEHSSDTKSVNPSLTANKNKIKNWGLIWSKKNCETSGIDFRLKNILLRGNPDVNLIKPSCRLCNKSYDADLMYIRCETCQYWFHADAVELDESKIFGLVGFKCCKCRRIRSPMCPYSEKKKALEDKIVLNHASKQDISGVESDYGVISEHYKEEVPTFFEVPMKSETSHVVPDHTLHFDPSKCKQYAEAKSQVACGWSNLTVSIPGPQKLAVRRHVKQEKDAEMFYSSPSEANVSNFTEKFTFANIKSNDFEADDTSSLQESPPKWAVSNSNFDDCITLDYDCLDGDDMEFEPQTYFSFNELLASDDIGRANGDESLEWETPPSIPEDGILEVSCDHEEPTISVETVIHLGPCKICSHTEPYPDLSCQICGMWIHSHCSPWVEPSSLQDGWKCGHCRDWR